ncbi:LPS assembly protein LptD [Candidatus Methylomirabilis sp.]|uniref:LPS-assembly protein LptD n=1 Tax=Candidatus Methylomirabilis sp. TaxID=2032687 RepID=UPI002A661333|nr:LPS assembly protein LptD [Candidatus Methylomirabilis sp.]
MPRYLLPVLLTLFALTLPYFTPVVSAEDTGSGDLLEKLNELKSTVRIEANEMERRDRDKLTIARGDVRIQMENRILQADEVELDQVQEVIRAKGRVQLVDGASRLDGDRLEYHYRTNMGVMYQAKGAIPPATTFQGVEIHKEGEGRYRLVHGSLTTCRICQPESGSVDWEIRAKEAVIEQDEYLEAKWASFWVRGLPSPPVPYLIYPIGPRRTGLLIPSVGTSSLSGFTYRQPFFWAIDESQDLTFTGVYRTKQGVEGQATYRYVLGPEASGFVDGRVIQDRRSEVQSEVRATITARHDQQWNPELSLKSDINYVSDRRIQRRFPETPSDLRTANFTNSRVFLTQLWPNYGLQFLLDDARTLEPGTNDSRLSRIPALSLSAFPQHLFGSPILLESQLSGTYLQRKETPDSGRVDLFPKLSLPWRLLPWATMTPSAGFRETAYTKHSDGGAGGTSRELFEARNEFQARFFRGFEVAGTRVDRLVHLFEPRLSYWYINAVGQQRIPQFDNVDFVSSQNRVTYSLTNRLLAKLKEDDGSIRTHELVSLSLSQSVNLNRRTRTFSNLFLNALTPERIDQAVREETAVDLGNGFSRVRERRLSNLVADLRASPLRDLTFYGVTAINTERNRVDGIEAGVRVAYPEYGRVELAHTFIRGGATAGQPGPFSDRETSGIIGRLLLTPLKSVAVNYLGRYDPRRDKSLENNVVVTYATCCWMVGLRYLNRAEVPGRSSSENSVEVFFELLTGGAPPPPERGAQYLRR